MSKSVKATRKGSNKSEVKSHYNILVGIVLVAVIIVVVISGIYALNLSNHPSGDNQQPGGNNSGVDEGDNFAFYTLDGSIKHLSDYRGKVVILDMWATWCQPCQYEMLELKKIYSNYSKSDLQVISVNVDSKETAEQIQEFIAEFGQYGYSLDWTFGMEKDNLEKYMSEGAIPTLCMFDQKGNLYFRHAGVSFFSEIPSNWPADQPEPPLLKPKIDGLIN